MSAHRGKNEEFIKISFSFAFIVKRRASSSIIPEKRLLIYYISLAGDSILTHYQNYGVLSKIMFHYWKIVYM